MHHFAVKLVEDVLCEMTFEVFVYDVTLQLRELDIVKRLEGVASIFVLLGASKDLDLLLMKVVDLYSVQILEVFRVVQACRLRQAGMLPLVD